MPVYEYQGIDKSGKNTKGTIDAESERSARQKLRGLSIYPTSVKEAFDVANKKSKDVLQYFQSNKLSTKDLSIATRQLATLIGAGLPLVTALSSLSNQAESPILKRIATDVKENVQEGESLSKSLDKFPKSFPKLYINMVAAGEAAGNLHGVLEDLADYLEAQVALKSKIRSALMYPVVMMIVCFLVIALLFIFVIPNIVEIYTKQGAILPLPTQIMIGISDFLKNYWWSIPIFAFLLISLIRWYYKTSQGRSNIDRLLMKLPVFGPTYLKINTARVAQTLGTLLNSGVQLLKAMDITKKIISNIHIVEALENAKEGVREGKSLAQELSKSNLFPSMLMQMISVGEQSGELESMLDRAGTAYEKEVNSTVESLTSIMEPVLMVIVGGIVLCIVISVLLPMADLIEVIGG